MISGAAGPPDGVPAATSPESGAQFHGDARTPVPLRASWRGKDHPAQRRAAFAEAWAMPPSSSTSSADIGIDSDLRGASDDRTGELDHGLPFAPSRRPRRNPAVSPAPSAR